MNLDLTYWMHTQDKLTWIGCSIVLIIIYGCLYLFLDIPSDMSDFPMVNPIRTLLGGIATGLITAQALIFTITLVAAQLNARYSHSMITRVFTWPTALLMGLYMFSSLYAMVTLATLSLRPSHFLISIPFGMPAIHPVAISLALAATCLILLLPYLWSFKRILNPEHMANYESHRLLKRLSSENILTAEETSTLDNITMSAFGYRDYKTYETGFTLLCHLAFHSWKQSSIASAETIQRSLVEITISCLDDPRAPRISIDALSNLGKDLAKSSLSEGARQILIGLSEIGEITVGRKDVSLTRALCLVISDLGELGAESTLGTLSEESAYSLGRIGSIASSNGFEDLTRQIVAYTRRVGYRSSTNGQHLGTNQALSSLWLIGGTTSAHMYETSKTVARELEMLELSTSVEQVDRAYNSIPVNEGIEAFRAYYLTNIRGTR